MMTQGEFIDRLNKICYPLPGSIPYSYNYKLTAKKADVGKTILEVYSQKFNRLSIDNWKEIIARKQLLVNTNIVTESYLLKPGDITSRTVHNITEPTVSSDIKLLYLDEEILVVDKPSPLPTSASGRFIKNTLIHLLELIFDTKLFSVHRLDANTTGLVVFALNKQNAKSLIEQFQAKTIKKTYLALVEGLFSKDTTVNQSISKITSTSGSREISEGTDSRTHIKVITSNETSSLLEVKPETGRTNQIRLHLASTGHPICGDIGYKDKNYFQNNPMTYPNDQLFLHAWKLSFNHPKTNELTNLESDIPSKYSPYIPA